MTAQRHSIVELAKVFLRLGFVAFGGPAAHIALMEDELVERRKWLEREQFLDFMALTQLIPGPNSTELVIHLGQHRAGWRGLVVAGMVFLLPACVMSALLGWVYLKVGALPEVAHLLAGIKPVVVILVARALWKMKGGALKDWHRMIVCAAVIGMVGFGLSPVVALLAGAGSLWLARVLARPREKVPALAAVALLPLFGVFFKVGAVLFGSGYVLLAFLQAELVETRGWLTANQLMDAIAVGQITPGPLLSTSSFIGIILSGPRGALVATVGMFLPSFVFVALLGKFWPKMQGSPGFRRFLDGAVAGAVGLLAVALVQLAAGGLQDVASIAIAVGALVLWWWKPKLSAAWVLLAGAGAGWLMAVLMPATGA